MRSAAEILCKDRADSGPSEPALAVLRSALKDGILRQSREGCGMRLVIEIAATALLVVCITATSAAFAAGKPGRSADGLSCGFSVAPNASPAARCAAIRRQCGGKFYANACGDRLLSAAN